jgi:hypothetical protein
MEQAMAWAMLATNHEAPQLFCQSNVFFSGAVRIQK